MEAFEGSKNAYKVLKEKVKIAGKKAIKQAKKVAGIHIGPTTEANPSYFIVIASQGAMVRRGIELDSQAMHGLNRGDLVTCVEILGRRARIIEPVEGWVSIRTQENEPILMKTIAPDISVQVGQMEKRFAKLKSHQPKSDDADIVMPVAGQASNIPEVPTKESDISSLVTMKHVLTFKDYQDTSLQETSIPKLAMPGLGTADRKSKSTKSVVAQDLIDLLSDGISTREGTTPDIPRAPDSSIITPVVNLSPQRLVGSTNTHEQSKSRDTDPFSSLLLFESSGNSPCANTNPQVQFSSNPGSNVNDFNDWFS